MFNTDRLNAALQSRDAEAVADEIRRSMQADTRAEYVASLKAMFKTVKAANDPDLVHKAMRILERRILEA